MRSYSLIFILFFSIQLVAQTDYKRQLDSLTIVHRVCVIESNIRNHRVKMDQLKKQKQNLNTQLLEVQSFKLRRTEIEKEEQLTKLSDLIEANTAALTQGTIYLTTLINELVIANEEVKDLQNN